MDRLDRRELEEAFRNLKSTLWKRIYLCTYEGRIYFYAKGHPIERVMMWYLETKEIYEELIDGY